MPIIRLLVWLLFATTTVLLFRAGLYAEGGLRAQRETAGDAGPCAAYSAEQRSPAVEPQVMQLLAHHFRASSQQAAWLALHDMPMAMSVNTCNGGPRGVNAAAPLQFAAVSDSTRR